MNTASEKSLNIDWEDVDKLFDDVSAMPEGAITRRMIEERYGITRTPALDRMKKLERAGWSVGWCVCPDGIGSKMKYVYRED